jgi:hypothetical protein
MKKSSPGMTIRSCLVLSGGMDSAVLLAQTLNQGKTVQAVSFDYGSKHKAREPPMARDLCAHFNIPHQVIPLPFINTLFSSSLLGNGEAIPDGTYSAATMKSTVVPFRNGIMLAIAAGIPGFMKTAWKVCLWISCTGADRTICPYTQDLSGGAAWISIPAVPPVNRRSPISGWHGNRVWIRLKYRFLVLTTQFCLF